MNFIGRFLSLCLVTSAALAAEISLSNSNRPYAPSSPSSKGHSPSASLSKNEAKEMVSEFRGILSMGARNHAFEGWKAKEMVDCYEPEASDPWTHKCEIITGQGNGFYYFYRSPGAASATLQRVEVYMQTSDERFLEELKPTVRHLFGGRERNVASQPGLTSVGPIRHWESGSHVGDLFLDGKASMNGTVRFIWTRSPLARTGN